MWGAVGGMAFSGASAYGNYLGQKKANEMNRDLTREQMAFQERMSSSAHQREVVDLRKAGLNPILSAGGGGSSSPAGAAPNIRSMAEGASSSVAATPRMMAELEGVNANTARTKAETEMIRANAKSAPGMADYNELKSDLGSWAIKMLRVGGGTATGAVKQAGKKVGPFLFKKFDRGGH